MKYSGVGGQAVMEGVMMRNQDAYAVAVRKSDGTIEIKQESLRQPQGIWAKARRIPFVRGSFSFFDSMKLGMQTLEYSASFAEEEESQPGVIEKKLGKKAADDLLMAVSLLLSLALSLGLFMFLPSFLVGLLKLRSSFLISLLEGLVKIALFVAYIVLISQMKDIRRVFMYHGAEHKCINCIEHGLPLTVEHVRASSKEHKRCGTSFLLFVMTVSILVAMFLPTEPVMLRLATRLLMLPVVVGLSYELIRLAGRSDSKLVGLISKPGLLLQGLTTKEPDDAMIEVGIASVEAVFDWRSWQKTELGIEAAKETEEG